MMWGEERKSIKTESGGHDNQRSMVSEFLIPLRRGVEIMRSAWFNVRIVHSMGGAPSELFIQAKEACL
jgi:hypothetical protein